MVNAESRRLNFTNEGGVGGTFRLLKNITGMWLLEGCKKAWEMARAASTRTASCCEMAAAAEPLRSLIDPDDALFAAPDAHAARHRRVLRAHRTARARDSPALTRAPSSRAWH